MQTKYRQPLGKTGGCVVLVAWIVGCLVGYQCKYRQHLRKTQFGCLVCWRLGGLPTLFDYPSFGWCVGWFSLLGLLFAWIWRKRIQ